MIRIQNIPIFIFLVLLQISLCECSKEEAVPVVADFSTTVVAEDYSVPVQVVISNRSEGAEEYEWTFEGGEPSTSVQRNPGTILYKNPGEYTITLQATNRDGSKDQKEITLNLDAPVIIDFKAEIQMDNFAPVTVGLTNTSIGATTYQWSFEGGSPATTDQKDPGNVVFEQPGEHKIMLEISNGRETYTKDTTITVAPFLIADFDWEVDFQDKDLQAPVQLSLQNKSNSATSYQWAFQGGTPLDTTEENPTVVFTTVGVHNMTLTATNGKETKSITKTITVLPDTNIKVFENIHLGINTAHNTNVIGSFFSGYTEQVYSKSQVTPDNGARIDLVFFGLNSGFSFNRFYAPNTLDDTTFDAIPNATHTKMINVMEACACGVSLTVAQFDSMTDDSVLRGLTITETVDGLQPFDNSVVPRIILFETADGRKGALKIKKYVSDGQNSYIETDIKIQKLPN
ncbi:PKD domain-containing protein [Aquimarina macrocephali]|uniref:PKD domain-containing protein n=1 Tax=Aquimarina macrocephali TaxID=666563 RepID=UPI00046657E4|nr:PKD domain-containing protein [Aquimarina macrocephali]